MDLIKGPVYFDANVFIYAIEAHETYFNWLQELFQHIADNEILVVTSELTLAECLVKPVKEGNQSAIDGFKRHIVASDGLLVSPVSRDILIRSASVRSELSLKLPDAIHMATAIENECLTFISNDQKLNAPVGMRKIYLKEMVS